MLLARVLGTLLTSFAVGACIAPAPRPCEPCNTTQGEPRPRASVVSQSGVGSVRWWVEYESDSKGIVEVSIDKLSGNVQLPSKVTTVECGYDAVSIDDDSESRWIRCSSPTWYARTLAACAIAPYVPTGSPRNDIEQASRRRDHSILVLKDSGDVHFGVGLRCETLE